MVVGTRQNTIGSNSYRNDRLYAFGKAFAEAANNILTTENYDLFSDPIRTLRQSGSKEALKEFFRQNFVDEGNELLSAEDIEDAYNEADEIFENDIQGIQENAYQSEYSPMVGMALPIHKLILMNNVFAQGGGIQRVTAVQPSFTINLERRFLVLPDGTQIDMFLEQNRIGDAIDSTVPTKEYELNLPQTEGATDIFGDLGGANGLDELSTVTRVIGVYVPNVYFDEGDHLPVDGWYSNKGPVATAADVGPRNVWFRVDGQFTPYYGGPNHNERVLNMPITIKYKTSATATAVLKDSLMGTMNNNKIGIVTMANQITKVKVAAKLNSSNAAREFASVSWKVDTDYVEIPEATPVNTTVSPEEVKDVAAMYDANQVTKIMSITKTALSEYKDKKIKKFLDESYARLDERTSFAGEFDFAVPEGYALDWVTFRHSTFMDYLDDIVTKMLQVLNDPNMTISIFGDPSIVRKITPKEYTYQAPANIGPVTLDYTQTIVNTSDNRVYNFVGSDKMRGTNELMIIINPRNTERFVYRIYDYQLYISNEIRNSANPALPAIHSFERFLVKEYQPVQARVDILNPSGMRPKN